MRKIIFALTALCLMSLNLSAQNIAVQNQSTIDRTGDVSMQVNVYATKKLGEKTGMYAWSLISENWSETYVGGTYAPASWIELGLAVGIESTPGLWRTASQIWMGNSFGSLLMIGEYGDSGGWYLAQGNHPILDGKAGIGFRAQRFVGVGPRVEVTLNKSTQIWVVPISWDPENGDARNALVTFKLTF